MDFAFTEDQEMFKDTARKFFANECPITKVREILKEKGGYSPDLWEKLAELGFMGLMIDEAYGGLGGAFMDLCPIIEEMGRALFPSPFLPTVVAGGTILSEDGERAKKTRLLPSIGSGEAIITLGAGEWGGEWSKESVQTKAGKDSEGYIIDGTKLFVPFAGASDYIICCARDESLHDNGISVFLVNMKDNMVDCTPIPTFSIEKYYKVDFKRVRVSKGDLIGKPGKGWQTIERIWPKIVAARCVEMTGGLQKVLDMTVQFVKEREQFGRPIGSFQTIQNYCSDIAIDVETSKYIAYQAAWKVSNNLPCGADVSIAKAWCGDAFQRATAIALQVHGAMGFTEEYDLHFFYKQAKSLQLMYGGSANHRRIVAEEMGL
ncbi:MAG: acyl-CoA/acyl-ACP dehydrogenase [Deltaproteobacteria bacterium]|nr:acyl-CoA/acyl-ACP dehydrogenase [Deltaproteobacteria bacterium]